MEVNVDTCLALALLREQHPDLAEFRVQPIGAGLDNAMFRLGETLVARIPRRAIAADLILKEQEWLPKLSAALPIAIPTPVRVGRPTSFFPWPWSVSTWREGTTADVDTPSDREAERLARFLMQLHAPARADAPKNPFRGVPLTTRSDDVQARLSRLSAEHSVDELRATWRLALDAPPCREQLLVHGDLHPLNILVSNGRITSIIDWGDFTAGDPAVDLASLWMLFDNPIARSDALARYSASSCTIRRARGWAVVFGLIFLDMSRSEMSRNAVSPYAEIGAKTLQRVIEENE
jgi:aminoglycoside phosphotransferase (APT) family kinase protein